MWHTESVDYEAKTLRSADFTGDPARLQQTLEERGALDFVPFEGGLFPASLLPKELAQQTEMDGSWFRDNAHVARALYQNGQANLAVPVGKAMLAALGNNRRTLNEVIHDGSQERLPVRVNGNTLQNMPEPQPRVQHDSTGYLQGYTSLLLADGAIRLAGSRLETVLQDQADIVRYLKKIEYWHDADAGHWEEEHKIHASSIGVVLAGLQSANRMFNLFDSEDRMGIRRDIQEITENGRYTFDTILAQGTTDVSVDDLVHTGQPLLLGPESKPDPATAVFFEQFSPNRREQDAALLFLVEPLAILNDEQAAYVVASIEKNLVRDKGTARYAGDTYWGPGFKEILRPTERTIAGEGRLERRNLTAEGIAYTQTEAQWTLFDPLLAVYYAKQHIVTGNSEAREKYFHYLDRSLSQLAPQPDGTLKWPEAYYHEFSPQGHPKFQLVPNDHTPLLWAQANNIRALRYFPRMVQSKTIGR